MHSSCMRGSGATIRVSSANPVLNVFFKGHVQEGCLSKTKPYNYYSTRDSKVLHVLLGLVEIYVFTEC